MNWKKLIPAYIQIRSLYWVEYKRKMNTDLEVIFAHIDNDMYGEASRCIKIFELNYEGVKMPMWVYETFSEIYKAKSMLSFLTCEQKINYDNRTI